MKKFPVTRENTRICTVALLFAFLGPLAYAWIVTNNTWNFFGWEHFGLVYNDYFLSMMKGTLAVTPEIIGYEGLYLGDKVYVSYGVVPALFRIFLAPFVDLETTFVTRLTTWLTASAGAAVMMGTGLRIVLAERARRDVPALGSAPFFALCIAIWFASPFFLMMGKAYMYHEQYSFGLLLVMLYVALLSEDVLVNRRHPENHLIALSVLAGLCVHTRVTVAVGLYGVTVCLVAIAAWRRMKQQDSFVSGLRLATLPMLVMFAFGAAFLALNYVRWGSISMSHPDVVYGYIKLGRAEMFTTHRQEGIMFLRMIPTTVFHFVGGSSLHEYLREALGLMEYRVERPYGKILIMWLPILALSAYAVRAMLPGGAEWPASRRYFAICALAFTVPAIIVLAYPLITVRYKFDLWPLLSVLAVFGFAALLAVLADYSVIRKRVINALFVAAALSSAYYTANIVFNYKSMRLKNHDYQEITTIPIIRDYFMILE